MLKSIIPVIAILTTLLAQDSMPFEIDIRSRIINESKLLVNVQITNLVDKPLDGSTELVASFRRHRTASN